MFLEETIKGVNLLTYGFPLKGGGRRGNHGFPYL